MKEILPDKTETPMFKLKEAREDYVSVVLQKDNDKKMSTSELNLALTWALRKAGVEYLDLTIREHSDGYEIIVET